MSYIPKALRQQVIQRARGLCEYCQIQQSLGFELHVDHIEPESSGGETSTHNLAAACSSCNQHKSDFKEAIDPETKQSVILYNPRTQVWSEHFQWSSDGTRLIGLTDVGRATIERLKINRPAIVSARTLWVKANWHPPKLD